MMRAAAGAAAACGAEGELEPEALASRSIRFVAARSPASLGGLAHIGAGEGPAAGEAIVPSSSDSYRSCEQLELRQALARAAHAQGKQAQAWALELPLALNHGPTPRTAGRPASSVDVLEQTHRRLPRFPAPNEEPEPEPDAGPSQPHSRNPESARQRRRSSRRSAGSKKKAGRGPWLAKRGPLRPLRFAEDELEKAYGAYCTGRFLRRVRWSMLATTLVLVLVVLFRLLASDSGSVTDTSKTRGRLATRDFIAQASPPAPA
eukprot:tig00020960_g16558.t1